ncbi:MAG: hypothetical protein KBG15_11195 [Kofleriaceae bacterium]|nr:hypothetical protein [Kofleriaceae bacterium]
MTKQKLPALPPAPGPPSLNDSYISGEFTAAAVHEFFVASQRMFRAAPWSVVPEFAAVFAVRSPELGLQDAVLAIVGPPAPNYGTMVFTSVEDFSRYRTAARALTDVTFTDDAMATMPAWVGSEFRPGAAISVRMLHEIKNHSWPIAGPVAFPIIIAMTAGGTPRATTAQDVRWITALHHAVAEMIAAEPRLGFAWEPANPATTRTLQVQLGAKNVAITLTAPHPNVALPYADAAQATGADTRSANDAPPRPFKPRQDQRSATDISKDKAKRKAQKAARKKNR